MVLSWVTQPTLLAIAPSPHGMPGLYIQVAMPTTTCISTAVTTATFTAPAGTPLPGIDSRNAMLTSITPTRSCRTEHPQLSHIGSWSMSGRRVSLKAASDTAKPTAITAATTRVRCQAGGRGRTGRKSRSTARRRSSGTNSVLTRPLPVRRAGREGPSMPCATGPSPCPQRPRGCGRPPQS